jgi:uncharacterized metal-binding protein YceD (DUF177 family)
VKIRFAQVKRSTKLMLKCSRCSGRVTKTVSVMHTVNPFNRDENGLVKSYERVDADVRQQLFRDVDAVKADPPLCAKCRKGCHA